MAFFLMLTAFALPQVKAETKQSGQPQMLAPGYGDLRFTAPIPGTYKLPMLGQASDGNVLDSEGRATTLHRLMSDVNHPGKVVLLSFIYATCSDVNGCPLATAVFHKIKNRLEKEPELASHLRLITLSFNPGHDTPEQMKAYGATLQGKGVEWHFLTTRSEQELQPILKAYKQIAEKIYDAKGKFTNTFSHNLRVYLIDQDKQLRNIYNTELLHPDMLISDIKTLLQPEAKLTQPTTSNLDKSALYSAGDNKLSYENKGYQTNSIALTHRMGKPADLLLTIKQAPLGLPPVPVPGNNPITAEKINLGRKLFYDRRLSINNTFSCAMCHIPEQGFTSNEMATAVGVEGRTVRRNSPTLYNVAYMQTLFHDSRETTLEQQVWSPLLAHNEMTNPSIGYVIDKIKNIQDYNGLFEKVFNEPPGMETIGMAIASYQRTLNSANSPFDRWYFGKDENALSAKAQRGFQLFTGKAQCSQCHTISKEYALFTDNNLHNTGIGYADAMSDKTPNPSQRVQVSPGVYVDVASNVIASVAEPKANDLGRYEVTQNPQDRWRYKTPSLRNVQLTAPYMHNGSIASLREVVEFYNRGGIANENLDPLIKPLHLTRTEIDDLTAFLDTLTGDNVEELVSDAFAAPVGDRD
ncbi:cytochrome c peroxidase [Methyloglobulus sp.]|uniref:cytochrome c peroxidase n=1 Tax=Methyloglobulus sp. TaxID=2518622 RepID=UPI0032B7512D